MKSIVSTLLMKKAYICSFYKLERTDLCFFILFFSVRRRNETYVPHATKCTHSARAGNESGCSKKEDAEAKTRRISTVCEVTVRQWVVRPDTDSTSTNALQNRGKKKVAPSRGWRRRAVKPTARKKLLTHDGGGGGRCKGSEFSLTTQGRQQGALPSPQLLARTRLQPLGACVWFCSVQDPRQGGVSWNTSVSAVYAQNAASEQEGGITLVNVQALE